MLTWLTGNFEGPHTSLLALLREGSRAQPGADWQRARTSRAQEGGKGWGGGSSSSRAAAGMRRQGGRWGRFVQLRGGQRA